MLRSLAALFALSLLACGGDSPTEPEPPSPHDLSGTYRVQLTPMPETMTSLDCTVLVVSVGSDTITWQRAVCGSVAAPEPQGGAIQDDMLLLFSTAYDYTPTDSGATPYTYQFILWRQTAGVMTAKFRGPCHDAGNGTCIQESGTATWNPAP
jgi:hypothetical protein